MCGKHGNFCLFSIYHNPDANDDISYCLFSSMVSIQQNDRKATFLFVGDFNAHHRECLSPASPTDCLELKVNDFSTESGYD